MSGNSGLQNSYGPEVPPFQYSRNAAPEVAPGTAPEAVPHTECPPSQYSAVESEIDREPGLIQAQTTSTTTKKRKILGLSVAVFWTLAGIAVLVTLGVGIGVGVGVGRKQQNSDPSPSPSTTPKPEPSDEGPTATNPTDPSFVTSGTTGLASNSCDFDNPRRYLASDGSQFIQHCFTDWAIGVPAVGGGKVVDLRRLIKYTFEDCMEACIHENRGLVQEQTRCGAVTYAGNLSDAVGNWGGNCFLKDKQGEEDAKADMLASAALER